MSEPNYYYIHFVTQTGFTVEAYFATENEAKAVHAKFAEHYSQMAKKDGEGLFCEPVCFEALNGHFVIQPSTFCCASLWSRQQAVEKAVRGNLVRLETEKAVKKSEGSAFGFGDKP